MSRKVQLPTPPREEMYAGRLVAELTRLLGDQEQRLEDLESRLRVETDLARAPERDGAIAVAAGEAYIGVAGAWRQITT